MAKYIVIGTLFTWTPQCPSKTELSSEEFDSFLDEHFSFRNDAHINGEIIYNDGESAIIEIREMTVDLFPFSLFYNEVKDRFPHLKRQNSNPYQKYLCVDIASMTSLFFYDMNYGYLADAEYDDEGNFEYYDLPEGEEIPSSYIEPIGPERITIRLDESEIEAFEDMDELRPTDDIEIINEDGSVIPPSPAFSWTRAKTWFNTKDCAILTAWRQGKGRKNNDRDNQDLQRQLRDYGYGVSKVTGWYPEGNKELAKEYSFLVVNRNDEESFRDNIFKLSEHYEQDSFLYKKAGYDTPAVYVYTNDENGKGNEKLLGRLRFGNINANAFSQIGSGIITFE